MGNSAALAGRITHGRVVRSGVRPPTFTIVRVSIFPRVFNGFRFRHCLPEYAILRPIGYSLATDRAPTVKEVSGLLGGLPSQFEE